MIDGSGHVKHTRSEINSTPRSFVTVYDVSARILIINNLMIKCNYHNFQKWSLPFQNITHQQIKCSHECVLEYVPPTIGRWNTYLHFIGLCSWPVSDNFFFIIAEDDEKSDDGEIWQLWWGWGWGIHLCMCLSSWMLWLWLCDVLLWCYCDHGEDDNTSMYVSV